MEGLDIKSKEEVSKFAIELGEQLKIETEEFASKFATDGTDAASLDASSYTLNRKFTEMIRLIKPLSMLQEKGIVRVQEIDDNTDKALFNILPQQSFTWTAVDTRGSEKFSLAAGSGSYQSYTAPSYVDVQPYTYSNTLRIHDNIRLVNPMRLAEIMAQVVEEKKYAKEANAYTTLGTIGNYTSSVSAKKAGGYASAGTITSAAVLTISDVVAAIKDLKTDGNRKIKPNVVLVATEQFYDLQTSSELAPGQTSSAYYKLARFDENGRLFSIDNCEIVESQMMPQITTGYFVSVGGHYAYVGQKGLIAGQAVDSKRDKVETWRDPKTHAIEITTDVNYATGILYGKAMRLIACADN